jgi:hypothetical protein
MMAFLFFIFLILLVRSSLDRLQIDKIGIGQLHWSTANYAPLQEKALWDGLVAMYEEVTNSFFSFYFLCSSLCLIYK